MAAVNCSPRGRARREEILATLELLRESGLSTQVFAAQMGIPTARLRRWRRQFGTPSIPVVASVGRDEVLGFHELRPTQANSHEPTAVNFQTSLRIECPGGYTIVIPTSASLSAGLLGSILAVLTR